MAAESSRALRYHLHTYGCQMNVRESDTVAALLEAAGYAKARGEDDADILIVNSCTVRDMAERKALGKCGNLCARKRDGRTWKTLPVTGLIGCAVARLGERVFAHLPHLDFAVSSRRYGLIPELVARALRGETRMLELSEPDEIPTGLGAHPCLVSAAAPAADFQAFVTILLGCDNRCSYCIVPDVRGHEYSRPAREVIAEVRALVAKGVTEVCLLGQSVLRYGRRNPAWTAEDAPSPGGFTEPFPRLLEALAAIPGLRRIRFTSAHPKGCTDELVRAYREFPQICRHLHLPVQSGSDRVLAEMGRHYTRAEYLAAVARLRALDPEFAVTTDVIVGYPGETAAEFEETRTLMAEAGFDNAFVFKYSPRPGTRSAALPDDVPTAEKERRDQVLLEDQEQRGQVRNERLIGTVREVLAEGPSPRNPARWSGRDSGNRIVVFTPPAGAVRGQALQIRITAVHPQTLIGRTLKISVLIPYAPHESHLRATVDGVRASIARSSASGVEWEIIEQEGAAGASAARTAALARATGDYVAWVDADDDVLPEWAPAIAGVLTAAEHCAAPIDILVFDAVAHWTDRQRADYSIAYNRAPGPVPPQDFLCDTLAARNPGARLWNRVFRRELLAGMTFSLSPFEDYQLHLDVMDRVRRVTYLPRTLYRYRRSAAGISQYGDAVGCLHDLLKLSDRARNVCENRLAAAARLGVATMSADFLYHAGRRAAREDPAGVRALRTFLRRQLPRILLDWQTGLRTKIKAILAGFGEGRAS